ncbi:hypothetical protein HYH03_002614 [Edaphochlamys debaryana]|uniref:C2 domain-containing protein n=1 Tax=Edaphochlamys debaryana TaxID=47281 RepID=A0A835YDF1_9CHLO|nr:hypothetical protein HYH03_002614 [Edaphochlamys debaryana]|eukprot:KAG2499679.1 hypothetical protein HYH03_002614 [Edaphochlamys debaryana]
MDMVGHCDAYAEFSVVIPTGAVALKYKTAVAYYTANPVWKEELCLQNVPVGSKFKFRIMDKDYCKSHDEVGTAEFVLSANTGLGGTSAPDSTEPAAPQPTRKPSFGSSKSLVRRNPSAADLQRLTASPGAGADESGPATQISGLGRSDALQLRRTSWSGGEEQDGQGAASRMDEPTSLAISPAPGVASPAGTLLLHVRCTPPSAPPGPLMHRGPCKYRVCKSRMAGALAYKLRLAGVPEFFPDGANIRWNENYDKAQQLFKSPALLAAVRTQHQVLYADSGYKSHRGVLRSGADLVDLLKGSVRRSQRRYYTYCITGDGSLYFSETGAAFLKDMMSKHAMHAGGAEKVVYAGEFCLVPPAMAPTASAALARVGSFSSELAALSAPSECFTPSKHAPSHSASTGLDSEASSRPDLAATSTDASDCSRTSVPVPPPTPSSEAGSGFQAAHDAAKTASTAAEKAAARAQLMRVAAVDGVVANLAYLRVHETGARGWRLVVDNNSGTYAPPRELLPKVQQLFELNFPGLEVEVIDARDPRLAAEYHSRVPSRLPPPK